MRRHGLLLACLLGCPTLLSGQSDPRLASAVRLAQDGLSDSARAVVGRLLAATPPGDSLYPEVLYTMGFLAGTEGDRRLYLRRVVVDYGQSGWADDALLQLAQLDYAAGNPDATLRQSEQLLRDYPASPLTAQAAFWGARAAGDRRNPAAACRLSDAGLAAAGDDVELRNQLEFQKQRCQGLSAMAQESLRAAAADSAARAGSDISPAGGRTTPPPPAARPPGRSGFYVQVSAVKTQTAAATEVARIKRAGYTGVIARESGLLKIRAGAFSSRAAAEAAARELRARLGGRPFVVRVP